MIRRDFRAAPVAAALLFAAWSTLPSHARPAGEGAPALDPSRWPKIAEVDPRYMSFNVEMAEVTGGEFWAPYDDPQKRRLAPRPPLDLSHPQLLLMARALAPAMVRVSGTWANSTYVPAMRETAPASPPNGFGQVLKQKRWKELARLAKATGNSLLLSFPASGGARDANGVWREEQAHRLLALTRAEGARVDAVEFINEPNLVGLGRLPKGYGAADYAPDFRQFLALARREAPRAIVLGHSAAGRGGEMPPETLFRETAGLVDAVSYHFYGALSERCIDQGNQTSAAKALTEAWLATTEGDHGWYAGLRDRYEPGKPLWLTETAQAACGGDRWASTFRDSFRFVDQLGRLAQHGVKLVAHNTLASGNYALIDRERVTPRPNFWAAWLWKKTMGTAVLRAPPHSEGLRLYAHCHVRRKGAVSLVAIVLADATRTIELAQPGRMSTLHADTLDSDSARINGRTAALALLRNRAHPPGLPAAGRVTLPPQSISFLEFLDAANPACE